MSPTEADLRAALRAGEGDTPDVDRLIAGGRARQAQSRHHLLAAAAVVLVVAGAGAGGAVLWGGSGSNTDERTNAYAGAGSATGNAGGSAALYGSGSSDRHAQVPAAPTATAGVACPAKQPQRLLPGGGSPGQFGADGPLFSRAVTAVVVCSYGTPEQAARTVAAPARLVLAGGQATELAMSLEHAATARTPRACPNYATSTPPKALAMIGVDTGGRTVGTVTTILAVPACNNQVTNGTAVRYQWSPPSDLQTLLSTLTPAAGGSDLPIPNRTPSGKVHPSPVKT